MFSKIVSIFIIFLISPILPSSSSSSSSSSSLFSSPLTDDQVKEFYRDGFTICRNMFSKEDISQISEPTKAYMQLQ